MPFKFSKLLRFLFANAMLYVDPPDGGGAVVPPVVPPVPVVPAPKAPNPLLDGPLEDVPSEWREHARELRRENAALRERTKQVDDAAAQTKIDDAVKKAVDAEAAKTAGLLKAANESSDKRTIASEVRIAATKLGIVDLDGLKLADTSALKVDPDTGEVAGVDELLTAFKTARPYLFKDVAAGSSNGATPPKQKPAEAFNAMTATPEALKAESKRLGISLKDH